MVWPLLTEAVMRPVWPTTAKPPGRKIGTRPSLGRRTGSMPSTPHPGQIAVGHGAVAQAGGRHRFWPEDLAVWPHVLGGDHGFALVAAAVTTVPSHPHEAGVNRRCR